MSQHNAHKTTGNPILELEGTRDFYKDLYRIKGVLFSIQNGKCVFGGVGTPEVYKIFIDEFLLGVNDAKRAGPRETVNGIFADHYT